MLTRDYFFDLPEELIAQYPADRRGSDRLLLLDRASSSFSDHMMADFPSLIAKGSVIVVNNSKVRKARVYGTSSTGGIVEFLFLSPNADHSWKCMVRRAKKQKEGKEYVFTDKDGNPVRKGVIARVNADSTRDVVFDEPIDESFFTLCGHVPLPPYIKREDSFMDESRYQTVYAKMPGSVAAPTAGLHFTKELMEEARSLGFPIYEVTLHVGAGTFLPVRTENIEDHHMHTEHFEIAEETAEAINKAKAEGRRILAVGTTSVRTLESAAQDGRIAKLYGDTDIFIRPGYSFSIVDDLLTNFHTPESTLLMLVSALAGKDLIFSAYQHAIEERYRFFSYGDAMYIRG